MNDWWALPNSVVVLGSVGVGGLVAAHWPRAQRAIAPLCLLAVVVVLFCGASAGQDEIARGTLAVTITWALLMCLLSWPTMPPDDSAATPQAETTLPLLLVLFAGLCAMSSAGDVVTLFVGLQLIALGTHVLSPDVGRARLQWLLAGVLLLGLVLLAAIVGSTRLETIAEALRTSYVNRDAARYAIAGGGSRLLALSAVLIGTALAGFVFASPFHARGVDAVERAPLPIAPALLLLPQAAGLLAWLRLWPATLTSAEATAQLLTEVLVVVTFVLPLLQARCEQRLSRQWSLLAMAQGGWLLLAMASRPFESRIPASSPAWPVAEWNLPTVSQSAWLWLLFDGVALIGLFGVLTYLRHRDRAAEFVDDLHGLRHFEPLAAVSATVCLLSLAGVPVLSGWWSRLFVALAAMNVRGEWGPPQMLVPHDGLLLLTVVVALGSVWSFSVASRSVWGMWFGLPLGKPRPGGSPWSLFSAVLAALILLGCGLLPRPLLSWLCGPE